MSRLVTNAIMVPSGDQRGAKLTASRLVSCVALDPSAFMTKMSGPPVASTLENAIFFPSGLQSGTCVLGNGSVVSCNGFVQSEFINHTCVRPVRSLSNAILVPSGDHTAKVLLLASS